MKKGLIKFAFLIFFLALALNFAHSNFVSAANTVCCERLTSGAWCQQASASLCATGTNPLTGQKYQQAPTSCSSTPFCSVGTCFNSQSGTCDSGVSQVVCTNSGGSWSSKPASELPQCQLGCCLLGNGDGGAQLTTQVKCKQLSATYGVNTNYNPSITSQSQCIALVGSSEKGACVFDSGSGRSCKMTTMADCTTLKTNGTYSGVQFYQGDLCTNTNLNTNCGPSTKTTCVPGKDGVYFVDTCGNLGNIYDASKVNNKAAWTAYWQKIIPANQSCNPGSNNTNSPSCGNCNYILGSTCSAYKAGDPVKPTLGGNYCKDLGCFYQGQYYQQGESWCALSPTTPVISDQNQNGSYTFSTGSGSSTTSPNPTKANLPGSSYTKLTCFNGQVTSTNCYDERQKVCVQDSVNGFTNAQCQLNLWQDCYSQTNESSCLDRTKRDCQWMPNEPSLTTHSYQNATMGACVPLNAPGLNFWNSTANATDVCSLATIKCNYKIVYTLTGKKIDLGKNCIDTNGHIKQSWIDTMQARCQQVGDCGLKTNYKGIAGEIQKLYGKIISYKSSK